MENETENSRDLNVALMEDQAGPVVDHEGERQVVNFDDYIQVVSFLVGEEEYGIEILYIHEINKVGQITRVPNVPFFIKGIMNLRGNVIPVVNLREKFGLRSKEYDDDTRIIVVELNQKLVAFIVDSVNQTIRVRKADVEMASDMIDGISKDYIAGVAKFQNRLVILLKLSQKLLKDSEEESGESQDG